MIKTRYDKNGIKVLWVCDTPHSPFLAVDGLCSFVALGYYKVTTLCRAPRLWLSNHSLQKYPTQRNYRTYLFCRLHGRWVFMSKKENTFPAKYLWLIPKYDHPFPEPQLLPCQLSNREQTFQPFEPTRFPAQD